MHDLRHAQKLARRRDTEARASRERAWVLSGQLRDEALLIFMLADCDSDPAVKHLASRARQHHWPDKDCTDIAALVSSAFLEAGFPTLAALLDTDAPSNQRALTHADGHVHQWSLAQWTKRQNAKGVAPSTQSVLDQCEAARAVLPASVRPRSWGKGGAARAKASRWRKRFKGRYAKLRVRQDVPVPVMQEKARAAAFWSYRLLMPKYAFVS